ncbi:cupin domain-containing protein [Nostoc sp.]|uniref:cupin domain-containing protein n=1 Tax=Nostoc sp. TaxID=1180 RepID=UPI002FFD4FB9
MNSTHCVIPVIKSLKDYQVYRINPNDSNRLAIIFDSTNANTSLTCCIEIFDVGGQTPSHRHQWAVEMFFILKGEAIAMYEGKTTPIKAGDSFLVPPTRTHLIKNTGSTRLYTLTVMVPNENFSELIRSGIPTELDAEDIAVLGKLNALTPC